jgi:hypothetical protein
MAGNEKFIFKISKYKSGRKREEGWKSHTATSNWLLSSELLLMLCPFEHDFTNLRLPGGHTLTVSVRKSDHLIKGSG